MRDLILQLLPEIGVLRVPGVPKAENLTKPYTFNKNRGGTSWHGADALGVPQSDAEHSAHSSSNGVSPENANQISAGTPGTFGTPASANILNAEGGEADFAERLEAARAAFQKLVIPPPPLLKASEQGQ